MRKIQLVLILIMFSTATSAQKLSLSPELRMLALGDSYTIGESVKVAGRWPHQFIDQLRSMGLEGAYPDYIATTGWTTRNLIQGINTMLDTAKTYNLVSILIGVNNQYQGASIDLYEPDLRKIISLALGVVNQDPSRVLILSIPDYAYTPFGAGSEAISREIDAYNAIKRKVADEYGITFVNITPVSREGLGNPLLVASDGLHPSELQYAKWVIAILPRLRFEVVLSDNAPEQGPEDLISIYPNPARYSVKIDSLGEINRIRIVNATGSIVSDQMISSLPAEMDISHLDSGIYVLWIYHADENRVSRKKLIVSSNAVLALLD